MSPFATANTVVYPNWYVNSGATNHVTIDYLNLSNPPDYSGIKKLLLEMVTIYIFLMLVTLILLMEKMA